MKSWSDAPSDRLVHRDVRSIEEGGRRVSDRAGLLIQPFKSNPIFGPRRWKEKRCCEVTHSPLYGLRNAVDSLRGPTPSRSTAIAIPGVETSYWRASAVRGGAQRAMESSAAAGRDILPPENGEYSRDVLHDTPDARRYVSRGVGECYVRNHMVNNVETFPITSAVGAVEGGPTQGVA